MADNKNNINLKNFYRNVISKNPLFLPHQFVVTFTGDVPEQIRSSEQTSITYYVKSAKIPGIDLKEHKISFLSQQFVVPGGVQYGNSWEVEVMMTNDLLHYTSLYEWQNWFADLSNNGGAQEGKKKAIPNAIAHVKLLDSTMRNVPHEFNLVGVFPTNIPDLKMKYENNSSIVSFNCKFEYQYLYENEEGDPLQQ